MCPKNTFANNDIHPIDFDTLSQHSEAFFMAFRMLDRTQFNANTLLNLDNSLAKIAERTPTAKSDIVAHANATRPILSETVVSLIHRFLNYKIEHGSNIEKTLYKHMTFEAFITRLLTQRPLMFMGKTDFALLRNGDSCNGGFEKIGTSQETAKLSLKEYLSYDEMQISALLGMSSPTHFINKGDRRNRGEASQSADYTPYGIYVGLVGARFEKPGYMEWAHMVVTKEQNTKENFYGREADVTHPKARLLQLWAQFYQSGENGIFYFPTYEEAAKDNANRFLKITQNDKVVYLNKDVYKKRIKTVIEPFLLEANNRAQLEGKKAYVHAVGLGLGVWQLDPRQAQLIVDVYKELIETLPLEHISDIDFSYFPKGLDFTESEHKKNPQIKLTESLRDPADLLQDPTKLIVASYAWDGNAYPGNEYWMGNLTASGDPAAACCSTISELQNPLINVRHVRGENLYLTSQGAIKPIRQYATEVMQTKQSTENMTPSPSSMALYLIRKEKPSIEWLKEHSALGIRSLIGMLISRCLHGGLTVNEATQLSGIPIVTIAEQGAVLHFTEQMQSYAAHFADYLKHALKFSSVTLEKSTLGQQYGHHYVTKVTMDPLEFIEFVYKNLSPEMNATTQMLQLSRAMKQNGETVSESFMLKLRNKAEQIENEKMSGHTDKAKPLNPQAKHEISLLEERQNNTKSKCIIM